MMTRVKNKSAAIGLKVRVVLFLILMSYVDVLSQGVVIVRPKETDELLNNPGKWFTTFQMFNGDNHKPNQDVLNDTDITTRYRRQEQRWVV